MPDMGDAQIAQDFLNDHVIYGQMAVVPVEECQDILNEEGYANSSASMRNGTLSITDFSTACEEYRQFMAEYERQERGDQ